MEQYKFDDKISQTIVNGILQGYKNYLEERNEKNESMKISSAYVYMRGNHIDDQTATLCEDFGIDFELAKAGYSWRYLQFTIDPDKKMFIVKNGHYVNKSDITRRSNKRSSGNSEPNKNHYLYKLSQINQNIQLPRHHQIEFPLDNETVLFSEEHSLFSIVNHEIESLQEKYDYFYIISYEIDTYGMIAKIQLLLPSPVDGKAHMVDDLTRFIESSNVDFTGVDTSISVLEQELQETEYPTPIEYQITTYDDIEDEMNNE